MPRPFRIPVFAAVALCCVSVAEAQGRTGSVAGAVRDLAGTPVVGAEIRVQGTAARALSGPDGSFEVERVRTGALLLNVRRLGFKPVTLEVVVAPDAAATVSVKLEPAAYQLAPITVAARPEVFDARLSGFYARSKGRSGHYINRERLQRLTSHRFTDLLREVPGVRLMSIGRGPAPTRSIRLRGATCPPVVFLDGFPAGAGEFDVDMLEPSTIEGIEIYHGMASVPAEFLAARGGERCGVIAIWSRPYRAAARVARRSGEPTTVAAVLAEQAVFTADRVDIPAELKAGTAAAVFPDSLWQHRVAGRVLAEFVVDTLGVVEVETVGIVATSHPLFSAAAIDALATASFRPALKNGNRVRQVVQLPFIFEPPRPEPEP